MDDFVDRDFISNRDWDPVYLMSIFECDFHDTSDLWVNEMNDLELLEAGKQFDTYAPVVEDISLDDDVLYSAVEQIETE